MYVIKCLWHILNNLQLILCFELTCTPWWHYWNLELSDCITVWEANICIPSCLPLKFKTIIKLRGITMINNQDNEKQMVLLVQKISTATLQSFVTFCCMHTSPVNSAEPGLPDNGDYTWPAMSLSLFSELSILSLVSWCKFAVVKPNALCAMLLRFFLEWIEFDMRNRRKSLQAWGVSACRHCKSARAFGNNIAIKSWAVVQVTVGISGKGRRASQSACFWVFKVKWPDICFVGAVKGETKTLKYNSLRYEEKTMLPNWSCCSWIIYSLYSPLDGTIYLSRNQKLSLIL